MAVQNKRYFTKLDRDQQLAEIWAALSASGGTVIDPDNPPAYDVGDPGNIAIDPTGAQYVIPNLKAASLEVFASAARIATPTAVDIETEDCTGCVLLINVTASADTPSVLFTISGKSGTLTWTILVSAAVTGAGQTVLKVGRALTAAANLVANDALPKTITISPVHGDADSITYSVRIELIP